MLQTALVILVLSFLSQELRALPATIHVRGEAQIADGNVELGAIADITSTNAGDERTLSALILGESPKAQTSVVWTAAEISLRLRPYSRLLEGVQFKLPKKLTITRTARWLNRDQLKATILDVLKTRTLPDPSWDVQVAELDSQFKGLDIPHDGSVQVVPPLTRPRGATSFEVNVVTRGRITQRRWVNAKVFYSTTVAVAHKKILPRMRLLESDVKWEKKDVTFLNDLPATKADFAEALVNLWLPAGEVIKRSHLERPQAVQFGEDVTIQAGDEAFAVTAKAMAMQTGRIGDTVKVRNAASNKVFSGVVIAKGVIRVNY